MGLYDNFAANLRRYCEQHGTIAEVCRAAGINRPQFNRYLAGTSLPSSGNLRKICKVLRVEEWQLLGDTRSDGASPISIAKERLYKGAASLFTGFETLIDHRGKANLKSVYEPGLYFQYSRMPALENFVLRSLIRITESEAGLTFVRLSRLLRKQSGQYLTRGKHVGIVFPGAEDDCLIGRNMLSPYQLTMVSMERWSAASGIRIGVMLTRTANSIMASRVLTEALPPSITLRQACAALGLVPAHDPSLPHVATGLLYEFNDSSKGFMISPSEDIITPIVAAVETSRRKLAK